MSKTDGTPDIEGPEREFRRCVTRAFEDLYPCALEALHGLLDGRSAAAPARSLPRRITIRNLGRAAGRFDPETGIVINSQLIDFPGDIRDTVAHELAHAVVETARRVLLAGVRGRLRNRLLIRQAAHRRGDWAAHGAVWRSVARRLGDSGDRCHALPLQPLRRQRRFLYRADCGAEKVLTTIRHNRLQRNRRLWYQWRADGVQIFARHFVGEVED